jgi:archaellum biogenesis ATPase FlaH
LSGRALTESERASLNLILEDLRYLFEKEVILQEEIDDVLQNLKSDEVRSYISSLRYGSKPESALRESFIAGRSILLK